MIQIMRRAGSSVFGVGFALLGCGGEVDRLPSEPGDADASLDGAGAPSVDAGQDSTLVEDGGFVCAPEGYQGDGHGCPAEPRCDSPVGSASMTGTLGGGSFDARGAGSWMDDLGCSASICIWTIWVTLTESPWTCGLVGAKRPKNLRMIQVRLSVRSANDGAPAPTYPPKGVYATSPEVTIHLTSTLYDNQCSPTPSFDQDVEGSFTLDESYPDVRGSFALKTSATENLAASFVAPTCVWNPGSDFGCCPH